MRARIPFVSDLHKRNCDFSTIAGYMKAMDAVRRDILSFIKQKGITHLVSLGDWYDKGYRSINRSNNDRNLGENLSKTVNGNLYICLGNHFFLERNNNPEMYLIQPSGYYKPSQSIYATSPIIRAVPSLRIGPVQISFFHYSKENKNYITEQDPEVKYYIDICHDDTAVPTQQRNGAGFRGTTMASYLDNIFESINLAIVGHIHTPVDAFNIRACDRSLPMIIPGSMTITTSGSNGLHTDVNLPAVEIADDGRVSCALYTFDLRANLLHFYKREGKSLKTAMPEQAVVEIPKTVSLVEYLRAKGFNENQPELVDTASEPYLEVVQGLKILGLIGGAQSGTA